MSRIALIAVVSILVGPLWSPRAEAICLGCPPVAWNAEITMKDGTVHDGWLVLSYFLVQDRVDLTAGTASEDWTSYGPKTLRLWTRAFSPQLVVPGRRVKRSEPQASDTAEATILRFPSQAIAMVGPPQELAVRDIATIEDRSVLEGGFETSRPVFYLPPTQAQRLAATSPAAALEIYGNDGGVLYCLWFDRSPSLDDQVKACREDNAYTAFDPMAGDVGQKEESSVTLPLVLVSWAGT
ncbi:MAG: hypothetical protein KDD11_20130 [Acidobacteria bacterium]|nr:hypothetical protein [Acidobacteriota bacterium]